MKTNKKYMVVQIGCIECGVSSYPIGLYNTLEEAIKVKEAHPSTWVSEGGEGYVEIWEVNKEENFVDILPIKEGENSVEILSINEGSTAGFTEWKVVTKEGFIL